MESINDVANRIEDIEWYLFEKDNKAIGRYRITTDNLTFSIMDTNDTPCLKNNLESKIWVAKWYGMLI